MRSKRAVSRGKYAQLLLGTVLAGGFAAPVFAQNTPAPEHVAIDANGVDLINGRHFFNATDISIGPPGPDGLAYTRNEVSSRALADANYQGWLNVDTSGSSPIVHVTIGQKSERFVRSGSTFVPANGGGSTLTGTVGGSPWIYTTADGTVYTMFSDTTEPEVLSGISKIKYPTGQTVTLTWKATEFYIPPCYTRPCTMTRRQRLSSITNSSGYQLKFTYASNFAGPMVSVASAPAWLNLTQIQAINNRVDPCDPAANTCTGFTQSWPVATYSQTPYGSGSAWTVVNDRGESWYYAKSTAGIGIKRPSASSNTTSVTLSSGKVSSVTNEGITTAYSFVDAGSMRTATVTAPDGSQTITKSLLSTGQLSATTDPTGQVTGYQSDLSGRLTQIIQPEGNKAVLAYDARGNIVSRTLKAKSGSGLADIVTTASYPASCANPLTCNKPEWTRDAKGNQTDYTYDTTHGGVLTVTEPADAGGVRPQTRYGYTLIGGVWRLTSTSACQSSTSCIGTANETKTVIGYDTNLLSNIVTQSAGDGSVGTTTAIAYNSIGDVSTVDGPLAGTIDTTSYRYAAGRRLIGTVGPDPDGGGLRKPNAQRMTYNADGQVVLKEVGIVDDASGPAWTGFSSQEQAAISYDTNARPVKTELKSGGTTYAIAQTSYDALGRVDCTAQRMNPAVFGSLPASACALGAAGSDGPDRITRVSYDAAGRAMKTQTAYGTAAQADEVTTGYSANGQVAHVMDAENNRTVYTYDGHDRLMKTEYPSTTKGANVPNAGDYEQLGYDANGNVISRRLRDGTSIGYSYDNLDRMTLKDLPGSEASVAYGYDLLGRPIAAEQNGQTLAFVYDALGRQTSETTNNLGSVGYSYDAAGRRTSMTYPGSALTINYDYDVTGNVAAIRENGATSGVGVLASYAFDNLGRRTSVTFGNGSVQSFGYDAVSRLSSLTNDLGGGATAHDLTQSFAYNPASQIASTTRSNDAYAWQAHYNVDRAYVADGLNRIMSAGGLGLGYDARGNLTSSGSNSYGYNSENLLTDAQGAPRYGYDPIGRLKWSHNVNWFAYDGTDLIAEVDTVGTTTRRYVHGPGVDNPIVWYEGAGTSDRRFLMADERGSIASVTDSAGTTIAINSYDEYGIPAPGNTGRFGYTGQTWLPEVGMWYYKARIYSPTLGRFLQTDPIGYEDGMNRYNYVGSDPMNSLDPNGTAKICVKVDVPGTRIQRLSCVQVDGNGNGRTDDDDLSPKQIKDFARAFRGFIAFEGGSINNPTDISEFGKNIVGSNMEYNSSLRVAYQFAGYFVNKYGGELSREAWGWNPRIVAETFSNSSAHAYSRRFQTEFYNNSINGVQNYRNYSQLAAIIFHEVGHYFNNRPGECVANRYSRRMMGPKASGLGGDPYVIGKGSGC